jgi:hypothetical protein
VTRAVVFELVSTMAAFQRVRMCKGDVCKPMAYPVESPDVDPAAFVSGDNLTDVRLAFRESLTEAYKEAYILYCLINKGKSGLLTVDQSTPWKQKVHNLRFLTQADGVERMATRTGKNRNPPADAPQVVKDDAAGQNKRRGSSRGYVSAFNASVKEFIVRCWFLSFILWPFSGPVEMDETHASTEKATGTLAIGKRHVGRYTELWACVESNQGRGLGMYAELPKLEPWQKRELACGMLTSDKSTDNEKTETRNDVIIRLAMTYLAKGCCALYTDGLKAYVYLAAKWLADKFQCFHKYAFVAGDKSHNNTIENRNRSAKCCMN